MNKWDNYKKPTWTKQDNFFAHLKIALIILAGIIYNYLMWM